MTDKDFLLKGIKGYRTSGYSLEVISQVVPHLIGDLFRTFHITNKKGSPSHIGYDWGRLMEFQINLGSMIISKKFDYLDNVTLQFLNGFSTLEYPHRVFVKYPQKEIDKFIKICNKFKGLEWDDIVDEFVDSIYNLFASGKIINQQINKRS